MTAMKRTSTMSPSPSSSSSPPPLRRNRFTLLLTPYHTLLKATRIFSRSPSTENSPLPLKLIKDNLRLQPHGKDPIDLSTLPSLPPSILLLIFRQLDRHRLKAFFESPSVKLKSVANLVLTEQLALGISAYLGTESAESEQIRRKIVLCGSVKGIMGGDGIVEKMVVQGAVECEEQRKEMSDGEQVREKESVSGDDKVESDIVEGTVGRESDDLNQAVNRTKHDVDEVTNMEDKKHMMNRLRTKSGSLVFNTASTASIDRLPVEILLQILEVQSYGLLRDLLSLGPCQLRRVSETILFERRREKMGCSPRRREGCDQTKERGSWPAISEKGEQYLGRRFVLVNRKGKGGCEERLCLEEEEEEKEEGEDDLQLSLGSFWKVVCEDVDSSKATVWR